MPKGAATKRMKFTKDELGNEILLKDDSLQVMMEWEKPYMEACVDAIKPKGDVLEIGFGLGYSATHIQKFHPKSHTIIESDPVVVAKAKEWAKKHSNVTIVEGMWQDVLPKLKIFDVIFFDDYTPFSAEEVSKIQTDANDYQKAAKEAKSVSDQIKASLKTFKGIKFSDEQVHQFAKQVGSRPDVSQEYVLNFINNLKEWGHITEKQKELFAKELEKLVKSQKKKVQPQWQTPRQFPGDRFITFVEECLNKHMHPGAKLSAYMGSPESKLKHPQFQKFILSRKDVRYNEKTMDVEVPPNCQYYHDDKALVIVIEKK